MADNQQVGPTPDMHAEPAVTLGDIFANKVLLKAIITAFVALAAKLWNLSTDDDTIGIVTDAVFYLGFIATPLVAQLESRQRAKEQALATRGAVYSPATVQETQTEAYTAGLPPTDPKPDLPPPNEDVQKGWGVYNIDDKQD